MGRLSKGKPKTLTPEQREKRRLQMQEINERRKRNSASES